jgi:cytochrome c-type biogenesis protein CcmF
MNANALILLISLSAVSALAFLVALVLNRAALRAGAHAQATRESAFLSRESFYGIGVWLLSMFAVATGIGMSVPVIMRFSGMEPRIIEEWLYNSVLAWLFPPLMVAMAIAPFLNWKGLSFRELFSRITNSLAISIGIVGFILLWMKSPGFHAPGPDQTINFGPFGESHAVVTWVLFLSWLCLFVAVASFWRMMESLKKSRQTVGAMMAHFGIALALLGLVFSRGFEQKAEVIVHPSEGPTAFGYSLETLEQTSQFSDRNNKIPIRAVSATDEITATPSLYYYPGNDGEPTPMAWPSIVMRPLYDYYFAISEPVFDVTEWTPFVLTEDPIKKPDLKAHTDVVLMYTGYSVKGSVAEDGESVLTANMVAVMDEQTYELGPSLRIKVGAQPESIPARIGDRYWLSLGTMDPKTHAITVKLDYVQPAYPVVVYFKPLTLFVWLGIGIMALGGLLAAAGRRKESSAPSHDEDAP